MSSADSDERSRADDLLAVEPIAGLKLNERATLLLETTRPLTRHDLLAIRAAAELLLRELAARGLIEQGEG